MTDGGDGRCGEVALAVGHTVELHWMDRRVVPQVPFDSLQANLRTRSSSWVQDGATGSFSLCLAMEKQMALNMQTPGAFTVGAYPCPGRDFFIKFQLWREVTRKYGVVLATQKRVPRQERVHAEAHRREAQLETGIYILLLEEWLEAGGGQSEE